MTVLAGLWIIGALMTLGFFLSRVYDMSKADRKRERWAIITVLLIIPFLWPVLVGIALS